MYFALQCCQQCDSNVGNIGLLKDCLPEVSNVKSSEVRKIAKNTFGKCVFLLPFHSCYASFNPKCTKGPRDREVVCLSTPRFSSELRGFQ
jgi:hypothetical protein